MEAAKRALISLSDKSDLEKLVKVCWAEHHVLQVSVETLVLLHTFCRSTGCCCSH